MENRYASRIEKVQMSSIRVVMEKVEKLRSQGKSVVSLCAGEPDFNTPEGIKKATIEALNDNQTHYSSNRGYLGLRKKVAHLLKEQTTIDYDSDTEIIMTCGCSEAINNVCQAFINKDDEVIIFTPAFVSYQNTVLLCKGIPVEIPLKLSLGFQIDIEEVKEDNTADEAVEEEKAAEDAKDKKEEASKEAAPKKEKKFGKKKDKAVEKLEEKVKELEDMRVRQLAEFENFRKRSEKEKSQMFEVGAKSVIEKILPVIDNFERGLQGVPEEEKDAPFVKGVEMVYKQMLTAFDEMGVKPIDAVGKEFDPNLHNAVMAVDDDSLESGTVAEEMQKGYMYKESVVRHSMVKVVN